jgi:hypothetical protein
MRYDARRKRVLVDYGGEKFLFGQVGSRQGEKDGAVGILDLDGNNLVPIPTGGHPEALQPEEKGNPIFINSPDNHCMVVADLYTNKVTHWGNPECDARRRSPSNFRVLPRRQLRVCNRYRERQAGDDHPSYTAIELGRYVLRSEQEPALYPFEDLDRERTSDCCGPRHH